MSQLRPEDGLLDPPAGAPRQAGSPANIAYDFGLIRHHYRPHPAAPGTHAGASGAPLERQTTPPIGQTDQRRRHTRSQRGDVGAKWVNGSMSNMTPATLSRELGVSKLEMYKALQELHINVKRMAARLNQQQEARVRTYFTNRAKASHGPMPNTPRVPPSDPPPAASPHLREFPKTCNCCDRLWLLRAEADTPRPICDECVEHHVRPDEPIGRRLERAESHARIFRAERDRAFAYAAESDAFKRIAYESRAKWRAALVEVVLDHDEDQGGLCWCGDALPCRTWRMLEEANKGIHRNVERWASWSDKRLDEFLYGEGRALNTVIDEDERYDQDAPTSQ